LYLPACALERSEKCQIPRSLTGAKGPVAAGCVSAIVPDKESRRWFRANWLNPPEKNPGARSCSFPFFLQIPVIGCDPRAPSPRASCFAAKVCHPWTRVFADSSVDKRWQRSAIETFIRSPAAKIRFEINTTQRRPLIPIRHLVPIYRTESNWIRNFLEIDMTLRKRKFKVFFCVPGHPPHRSVTRFEQTQPNLLDRPGGPSSILPIVPFLHTNLHHLPLE